MRTWTIFFIFSYLRSIYAICSNDNILRLPPNVQPTEENSGKALFLTPYLESGQIELARNLSYVEPLLGTVRSYSGFFTINKTYNSNLFFWYFPAEKNVDTAPLALWFQGGPGVSSLSGIFGEIGPYNVVDNNTIELRRKYYWNENVNVLFIDNPVGTGYSFTDSDAGYSTNEDEIADNLYAFLIQFYKLFAELSNRDLYLAGESYGCKYVSVLAYKIHRENNNISSSSSTKMNLKGISIGDGYCDPINMLDYGDYLYQIGLVDDNGRNVFNEKRDQIIESIRNGNYVEATRQRDALIGPNAQSLFFNLTGFQYRLNMLQSENSISTAIQTVSQNILIRKAIHVGNSTFANNVRVMEKLAADRSLSVASTIQFLIELYPILFYNGQFDALDGYTLTVNFLKKLTWNGSQEYGTAGRKIWRVNDDIAGYVRMVKNMTEAMVRNAGHMVPLDQQQWSYNLIVENFMLAQPLDLTPIQ